jgi:flagellar hook assembly protein FlgD
LSINYLLEKDSTVSINIYTLLGDLVKKMSYASGTEGGRGASGGYNNKISWDGRNDDGMTVGNGVYILRIRAEPSDGSEALSETKKVMVVK